MRGPADEGGLERAPEIRAHVEVARAWSAAQPFDRSADGEVRAERRQVDGNDAGRLIDVEDHVRAHLVGLVDHRARVLDEAAAEEHQRQRHQQRSLVDGVEQALEIGADAVFGLDQDDLRAVAAKAPEHVDVGRKLEADITILRRGPS